MAVLKDWIKEDINNLFLSDQKKLVKLLDVEIVKEFSMVSLREKELPWLSWREFGTHKNVVNWVLLETGHAVGFNENVSIGIGYPVVKLSEDMLKRAKSH